MWLLLFSLLLLELYDFRSDRVFAWLHWNTEPCLWFALSLIYLLLPILETVRPKSLSLLFRSLSTYWARFRLLVYRNLVSSLKNMFSWLYALLLQTIEQSRWRHLGWVAYDEVVDVVVVNNIGDVCCLLNIALVFFLVGYWRLVLFKLLVFVWRHELTRSFRVLLVIWRNNLRLLFALLRLFFRLKVAHFEWLHNRLFYFLFLQQISICLLFFQLLTVLEQVALPVWWLDLRLLSDVNCVLW